MLSTLKKESTKITPEVLLDQQNQKFIIKGRSFPENTIEFYQPILQWIQQYIENPNESSVFEFDMEYFNSSSARIVYKILLMLEKIQDKGKNVVCRWYINKTDYIGKERIEEMRKMFLIPIEINEK